MPLWRMLVGPTTNTKPDARATVAGAARATARPEMSDLACSGVFLGVLPADPDDNPAEPGAMGSHGNDSRVIDRLA